MNTVRRGLSGREIGDTVRRGLSVRSIGNGSFSFLPSFQQFLLFYPHQLVSKAFSLRIYFPPENLQLKHYRKRLQL